MRNRRATNWVFRIVLMAGVVLGAASGFALGSALVLVNARLILLGAFAAGIPISFVGGVFSGVVFNHALRAWRKAVRLLAAFVVMASGVAAGTLFAVSVQRLDAVQLFAATGAPVWNVEWLCASIGLAAGMWPGWTFPLARLTTRLTSAHVEMLARVFDRMGHVCLWLPQRLLTTVRTAFRRLRVSRSRRTPQAPAAAHAVRRVVPRHLPEPGSRLPGPRRSGRAQHADQSAGPRVVAFVEDRCPYCFDIVKRNDPRGVRVCPICGTPHHADCWAITGKCQVPHLNT